MSTAAKRCALVCGHGESIATPEQEFVGFKTWPRACIHAACAAMGYLMSLSGYLDLYPVLFHGARLCLPVSITHSLKKGQRSAGDVNVYGKPLTLKYCCYWFLLLLSCLVLNKVKHFNSCLDLAKILPNFNNAAVKDQEPAKWNRRAANARTCTTPASSKAQHAAVWYRT
jgi:hypothetical protein